MDNVIQSIKDASTAGRTIQSMLFLGPVRATLGRSASEVAAFTLCGAEQKPCGVCSDCAMVAREEHPDLEWIRSEKEGGAVKVDQIRELQQTVYLSPKRSSHRVIIIESADHLNTASSNALLKILEEPPAPIVFILIAERLTSLPPTILSRCHLYRFQVPEHENVLELGQLYDADSRRGLVFQKQEAIIAGLLQLLQGRTHPCELAALWQEFDLEGLLWFLQLLYTQICRIHALAGDVQHPTSEGLDVLAAQLPNKIIFKQLDKIYHLQKKISHNMNINKTLAIEHLLFDFYPEKA